MQWMPMLCEKSQTVPTGDGWVLEPKLDGWRCIAMKGGGVHTPSAPSARVYGGRNGSDYTGVLPYIEQEVFAMLPRDSVIDGELVQGDGQSNNVQSVMRSSNAHQPSAASPALTLVVFDVLQLDGHDIRALPWQQRRELLDRIDLRNRAQHMSATLVLPAIDENHTTLLDLGCEGSVAKRVTSVYRSGTRTREWLKIKPPKNDTVDCRITGFTPGEIGSDFEGLVGAIEFELPNGQRSSCSGFEMKLRKEMTANPTAYIGMVVEVRHWGETAAGKLRHPQFHRLRYDR